MAGDCGMVAQVKILNFYLTFGAFLVSIYCARDSICQHHCFICFEASTSDFATFTVSYSRYPGDQETICNAVSAALHHAGPEWGNETVVVIICPNQYSVTFS